MPLAPSAHSDATVDPAYGWDGDALDLDAYLLRIGYTGPRVATAAVLRELQGAHTTTIPFENLATVLGRPVPLDTKSLQDKIVRQQRGGYCYEQVGLFAAALERLGFGIIGLHGRVGMGSGALRPATHALLRVTAPGDPRIWLCDVGFGSGPAIPLELDPDAGVVQAGEWRFRLDREHVAFGIEQWTLHQIRAQGPLDRHSFTMHPQFRVDYEVGNHFVATAPHSPFVTRPFVQRFHLEANHVLEGLTIRTEYPDGSAHSRELAPASLPDTLAGTFDIALDDAAADELVGWVRARA